MKKTLLAVFTSYLLFLFVQSTSAQTGSGWVWSSTSGKATNSPGRQVHDIATDAAGNVYTIGFFMGSLTIGPYTIATTGDGTVNYNYDQDIFIAKYDASGNVLWLKRYGEPGTAANDRGQVIIADAAGNVYAGIGNGASKVIKFDTNGNELWSKTLTLFEVNGINISPDGSLIVMTSNQTAKDVFKLDAATGNIQWTVNSTGIGNNSTSTFQDFVDASGNIYFTAFSFSGGAVNIAGQTSNPAHLTTYIVSLTNSGALRWVQAMDNVQVQLSYTIDKAGKSYIQIGGGFGGTFQGISTASPLGSRYFELDADGNVVKNALVSPYKGLFRVKDDGIYGFVFESGGANATVVYGDYAFKLPAESTKGFGIVVKYDKSSGNVVWANNFELNGQSYNAGTLATIETGVNGAVLVGGNFGTIARFGSITNTSTVDGGMYQTDFYVAQFNGANVQAPPVTTWTGSANNMNWNDAANWTNGVPNGSYKTIIGVASNYPNNVTATSASAKLEIAAGATVTLPLAFSCPLGIVNNGAIEITDAGTFYGGFGSGGSTKITGTGKVVIKNAGTTVALVVGDLNNSLEINTTGTVTSYGGNITGSLYMTNGYMNSIATTVLTNPNAVVTSSATSFLIGTLKRAINTTGTYNFPIGISGRYAPVTVDLAGVEGTKWLTVSFRTNINGLAPNTTAQGVPVTQLLNSGIWTIAADVPLTSGSYAVTLDGRGYTNGVTDAARYVVVKRPTSSGTWAFEGNNGVSTQANNVVTATAFGITGFSEFAIGIASNAVGAVLPLKLVSFTASAQNGNALLQWNTLNEVNAENILVRYSSDGVTWRDIASIKANNKPANTYQFVHANAGAATNYYMLVCVDKDGNKVFSEVRRVSFQARSLLKLYPNPIVKSVTVQLADGTALPLGFTVVDALGRRVKTGMITARQQTLNLSAIVPGKYFLQLSTGEVISLTKN